MRDILKLSRIQLLVIALYIVFKLIRPSVLNSEAPLFFKIFLLSFPNFAEGIAGLIMLTGLGVYLTKYIRMNIFLVYIGAFFISAVYVITQELIL